MRNAIAGLILVLAAALVCCIHISSRSEQPIAKKVTTFLIALFPPILGNIIIIIAHTEGFALFGRYLYAIGIDITMYCLLDFVMDYCGLKWNRKWQTVLLGVIALDIIQLLCNPFFGHAFAPNMVMAYGEPYYDVHSYLGRNLHLALVYVIMAVILIILLEKMIRGAKIYREKYSIIFALLLFTGLWEIFYLFSHTPVKRSVIAYGVFGILVFYFSLYYRPRRLLDHLLADLASGLTDGLFFFDDDGKCIWVDENGLELIGASEGDSSHYAELLNQKFPDLELENSDWVCRRTLGDRYYKLSKHFVYDNNKKILGSVLSVMDDTEAENKLQIERYIANHDPLTGLYTKKHLYEKVRERIDSNPDKTFYVAFADIKNFKMINDIFGEEFGDYALKSVAWDIQSKMPGSAIFGRIGSDTFGFCFSEEEFDKDLAEKFVSEFRIEKDSIVHTITIHEGVYKVTDRNMDVSIMFDRAHLAMDTIKNDYKKHITLYDDAMRENVLWGQEISMRLKQALEEKQIRPYLQPIVDPNGKMIGAEALVRWIHPEKGLLPPIRFIPVFEENGMISDIARYMWRSSCEILKRWQNLGYVDTFISVNISPKDFFFFDVREELKTLVREYGIPSSSLRIEITETVMMNDSDNILEILRHLRDDGFVIEMDDFGSGYSSLNMLKDMPVDVIKVDMKFINRAEDQKRSSIILRNMFNMISELGMVPLTEGIETEEQFRSLSQMGCELFQGYLFSKPMPLESFEAEYQIKAES